MELKGSGIYRIRNTLTGDLYVGSSVDVKSRSLKHLSHLRRGVHRNAHLQAAFAKYGEASLVFEMLEAVAPADLLAREQWHIDQTRPAYNICQVAGNTLGYRHTADGRAKMSVANMGNQRRAGKSHSQQTKDAIGSLAAARRHSPDARAKIAASLAGNQRTAGRPLTEAHRVKVGEGLRAAWSKGARSKEEAAARVKAQWADPVWKAAQLQKIKAAKDAKRQAAQLATRQAQDC